MATKRIYDSGADSVFMNDEDYAAVQKYGQAYTAAQAAGNTAGMQAAHDGAEAIRAKYNYSGGTDGSQYISLGKQWNSNTAGTKKTTPTEKFTYESAPTYTSKYQDQIDELLDEILNRPGFAYDPETDPRYAAYRKEYAREGQRATADTMGQAAAMTGGMPSTAAMTAAQQAGDYYAAQMADKIPELYQLAYAMYQDEGDNMRLNMDMLTALEQGDYNKYLNLLAQYNTDRDFAYGVYSDDWNRDYQLDRDRVEDSRYDMEWNYGVSRDEISDQRYEDETAWNREQYESEEEYNRALEKAQTLAAAGDFSGFKALGYTDQEISAMKSAYDRELAAVSGSGRSATTGSAAGSASGGTGAQDYDALFQAAMESGHAKSYIANNYKQFGFTSSSGLYDDYEAWEEETSGPVVDYDSVQKLGYGPISSAELSRLEDAGEIESYEEDGKIKFRKVAASNGQTGLLPVGFSSMVNALF